MLDIPRLRVVAAIAAQGSRTKAAKRLNYPRSEQAGRVRDQAAVPDGGDSDA
jgi:DNA-binding transcriptional LysR family regulator